MLLHATPLVGKFEHLSQNVGWQKIQTRHLPLPIFSTNIHNIYLNGLIQHYSASTQLFNISYIPWKFVPQGCTTSFYFTPSMLTSLHQSHSMVLNTTAKLSLKNLSQCLRPELQKYSILFVVKISFIYLPHGHILHFIYGIS